MKKNAGAESNGEPDPVRTWCGAFGRAYTDRNKDETVADVDAEYQESFGIAKTTLFEQFLGDLDRDARILEVGCNAGVQLEVLSELGFSDLYGVDVQRNALQVASTRRDGFEVVQADGRRLPFADDAFDLVFTVGVLIHIPPSMINGVLDEIVRCSRERIYGCEYYAPSYTEVVYRGESGVMWKTDFASQYKMGRELALVDSKRLVYEGKDPYTVNDQFVSAFLLQQ